MLELGKRTMQNYMAGFIDRNLCDLFVVQILYTTGEGAKFQMGGHVEVIRADGLDAAMRCAMHLPDSEDWAGWNRHSASIYPLIQLVEEAEPCSTN